MVLRRKLRTIRSAAAVLAASAVAIAAGVMPAAATDPERSLQEHARQLGVDAFSSPGAKDPQSRMLARLVDEATADLRIAQLLPTRARNRAIGRTLGVSVVDLVTGARVWSKRAGRPLLPASNMKLITAVNALHLLGPDHVFHTTATAPAPWTVVIKGGGDATLTAGDVQQLASQTATNMTRQGMLPPIEPGQVVPTIQVYVDNSLFAPATNGPGWSSGYVPDVVRGGDPLAIDGRYVRSPAADAAKAFAQQLTRLGHPARYRGEAAATGVTVADHPSRPLSSQISYMLQVSENNVAEDLARQVALARGLVPTWANVSQAASQTLAELGVPTAGLSLRDGSGVSRSDRLTAGTLTSVLAAIADRGGHPELASIYYGGSLPLAGYSGTLSAGLGRFSTRPTRCARGLIRAKTGTLYDTIALSGLATGADGHLKAFSIMVNKRPYRKFAALDTRRAVDAIATTVTGCW